MTETVNDFSGFPGILRELGNALTTGETIDVADVRAELSALMAERDENADALAYMTEDRNNYQKYLGEAQEKLRRTGDKAAGLRLLTREILAQFDACKSDEYRARVGRAQIAKWRKRAGLKENLWRPAISSWTISSRGRT